MFILELVEQVLVACLLGGGRKFLWKKDPHLRYYSFWGIMVEITEVKREKAILGQPAGTNGQLYKESRKRSLKKGRRIRIERDC